MARPNHIDIAVAAAADYGVPAETDSRYGYASGRALPTPTPFGADRGLSGFYDVRDELVGGTDNPFNMQAAGTDSPLQNGADWASYSDSAGSFNSGSGLNGERCGFSEVLSADRLAGDAFS